MELLARKLLGIVSEKTLEAHLRTKFMKLSVRSRAQPFKPWGEKGRL